jgi:menaquinone-specific isochorismate synthase
VSAQQAGQGGPAAQRLEVRTVATGDPGDLIAALPCPQALAWVRRGDGLVGWGVAAGLVIPAGEDRFTAGEKWLAELFEDAEIHDEADVPGSGPVAFGSFTFDPASEGSVLVVPRVILGRRDGLSWRTTVGWPREPAAAVPVTPPGEIRWNDGRLTAPQWERAVSQAVTRIRSGELGKVVLARELNATATADIDVRLLLARLAAGYPDCYTFSCAGLAGATPELLVRRSGTEVTSLVLAGTAPRGAGPEADAALGNALLASAKDIAEHEYAVTGVRDTLTRLCGAVTVDERPSLLRLANVQHLATRVSAWLADPGPSGRVAPLRSGTSALALAAALHPTAAVCGTPPGPAMDLIRELEAMDRGRYAGPVGWLDSRGNGEWGIALRCAELDGRHARLFAGCGIVADSDPAEELAEAQAKFRPMQQALEA